MKKLLPILISCCFLSPAFSQEKKEIKLDKEKLLAELSEKACKCIDSIPENVSKDAFNFRMTHCVDDMIGAYQIGSKLSELDLNSGDKKFDIGVQLDKNSNEYISYYYEMESYLMSHCVALKNRMAADDEISFNSVSDNKEALKFYDLGLDEYEKENYKAAMNNYKRALKIDSNFAFAYDNLGMCYRMLGDYDNAIKAYENSTRVNPNGKFPHQNKAIVYQLKGEYANAIKSYERLAEIDPNDPEVFYGIGQTYVSYLGDYEKGLDNLCKAYNIYVTQKSPFRSDAEKLIQMVYNEMKKQNKLDKFNEILESHNINMK